MQRVSSPQAQEQGIAYSNTKAMLNNADKEGHIFEGKHKPFTNKDIVAMLGVYIIDGLAPSPQLTQEMQPQSKQPTHGNNKVASTIGAGYQQKHRSFWHFFACQDPLLTPPPKDQCPNFKVDEFFRWLRHIWKEAWLLGEDFSMDEQTTKMQGKSKYKTCCGKFKRLGDGIQGLLPQRARRQRPPCERILSDALPAFAHVRKFA